MPPLAAVPAGEWFCSSCEMKRKASVVEKIWGLQEVATGAQAVGRVALAMA